MWEFSRLSTTLRRYRYSFPETMKIYTSQWNWTLVTQDIVTGIESITLKERGNTTRNKNDKLAINNILQQTITRINTTYSMYTLQITPKSKKILTWYVTKYSTLTIDLHANFQASAEATMLTAVSSCTIYEASTIFFALVYYIFLCSSFKKSLSTVKQT